MRLLSKPQGALLLPLLVHVSLAINLCHVHFYSADNNLESFLVSDLESMLNNLGFMSKEGYQFHLLLDRHSNYSGSVLGSSYNADGSIRTQEVTGAMQYELIGGKLTASGIFQGDEVNMDDLNIMKDFLNDVLPKCQLAGADTYFLQLSSHGGGFLGFGGDEGLPSRRRLGQSNADLVEAIGAALDAHGIAQLDLIGFDACLMASVATMRAYKHVARYLLASEATIPGHGWAFEEHSPDYSSVVEMAKMIIDSYVSSLQGYATHRAPKVLALLDLRKYDAFEAKLTVFLDALTAQVKTGDISVIRAINRALLGSVRFEGSQDTTDHLMRMTKSSTDLGSFLANFAERCPSAQANSDISASLFELQSAYEELVLYFRFGEGSPEGATGVHVILPTRKDALDNIANLYESIDAHMQYSDHVPASLKSFTDVFYSRDLAVKDVEAACVETSSTTLGAESECLLHHSAIELNASDLEEAECFFYPRGSLLTAAAISTCDPGSYVFQATLSSEVMGVSFSEVWVGSVLSHYLYPKFVDGDLVSSSFSGAAFFMGDTFVSAFQRSTSYMWTVIVYWFAPGGPEPVVDEQWRLLNSNAYNAYFGYLDVADLQGSAYMGDLQVHYMDSMASISPSTGGKIVPMYLTMDGLFVAAVVDWDEATPSQITAMPLQALGPHLASAPHHYFGVDTFESQPTACAAEVVYYPLWTAETEAQDVSASVDGRAFLVPQLLAGAVVAVSFMGL